MIEQEIEHAGAEEEYWRNPFEVRLETPVSRHDKPHIEKTENPARYSHKIVHIGIQPVLEERTDKMDDGDTDYAESD